MKQPTQRDALAAVAMHGILTACSSPQFMDRLRHDANIETNGSESGEIARRAYLQADAMIARSKKK